jgi:hypothetical protein
MFGSAGPMLVRIELIAPQKLTHIRHTDELLDDTRSSPRVLLFENAVCNPVRHLVY